MFGPSGRKRMASQVPVEITSLEYSEPRVSLKVLTGLIRVI